MFKYQRIRVYAKDRRVLNRSTGSSVRRNVYEDKETADLFVIIQRIKYIVLEGSSGLFYLTSRRYKG